jgi:colanic acid biosynthesis glycosyl transferase WcaI
MRILIITPHYVPDGGPSAVLFSLLSNKLSDRGHNVTILTGVPHYPTGKILNQYRGLVIRKERTNNIKILRVPLPSLDRQKLFLRFFQFVCFQLGALFAGLFEKYDIVLASNPALQTGLPFLFLGRLRGKPSIFSVHDVYPDVGIRLGILQNRLIVRLVETLEVLCYKRASKIRVLSESFIPAITRSNIKQSKIVLIYDWVDTDLIRPLPKENAFSKSYGMDKRFVVLYAGNLGLSQGLENIISAAEILAGNNDIMFVFVGDGADKKRLQHLVKMKKLTNVVFIPFQERSRLPEVLASADISIVNLKKGISFNSLPSKIYSILASGRPIIACIDEGSDTWNLIQKSKSGVCLPPGDSKLLAKTILELKDNDELRRQLGENGRAYCISHHSPQYAAEKFLDLFDNLVKGRQFA